MLCCLTAQPQQRLAASNTSAATTASSRASKRKPATGGGKTNARRATKRQNIGTDNSSPNATAAATSTSTTATRSASGRSDDPQRAQSPMPAELSAPSLYPAQGNDFTTLGLALPASWMDGDSSELKAGLPGESSPAETGGGRGPGGRAPKTGDDREQDTEGDAFIGLESIRSQSRAGSMGDFGEGESIAELSNIGSDSIRMDDEDDDRGDMGQGSDASPAGCDNDALPSLDDSIQGANDDSLLGGGPVIRSSSHGRLALAAGNGGQEEAERDKGDANGGMEEDDEDDGGQDLATMDIDRLAQKRSGSSNGSGSDGSDSYVRHSPRACAPCGFRVTQRA